MAVLCLLTNTPWPWPTPSRAASATVWEKWPSGQPEAGGSEYLELHGAFSIALRAPGAALLSRFGFLAGRRAREIALAVVLGGGALRGSKTYPLRWVAEDRRAGDGEGTPSPLRLLPVLNKPLILCTVKLALKDAELPLQADSLVVVVIAVVGCYDCILWNEMERLMRCVFKGVLSADGLGFTVVEIALKVDV